MAQKGKKEKIEKQFKHCCYCYSENCLVELDCFQNGCYVQHLQWDVSEEEWGR